MINAQTIAVNSFLSWDIWNDNFWVEDVKVASEFSKFYCSLQILPNGRCESMQMIFNLFLLSFQQFIFFVILCNHIFTLS